MNVGTGFSVEVNRANGYLAVQSTNNCRPRSVQLLATAGNPD